MDGTHEQQLKAVKACLIDQVEQGITKPSKHARVRFGLPGV